MAREYGKVSPKFWTGETGRKLRSAGRDAQVVAMYLLTCPSSSMIGLYYLPLPTISHETGIPLQGASKALRRVCDTGFCAYNWQTEYVFVPEMASYQIGEPLKPNDKQVKGIIREWQNALKSGFYDDFYDRYSASYHLPERSPSKGPSKPHRSQEQEQEHEQEQEDQTPSESCPEPLQASGPDPVVMTFPCIGGSQEWPLKASKLAEYAETYSGIDAMAEARKARQWCLDNPTNRKTAGGMTKFLNRWMARAQNDSRVKPGGGPKGIGFGGLTGFLEDHQ